MTDVWPRNVLCPEEERWSRSGRVVTGGQAVSGALPMGRTDGGGFWLCQQQGITLDGPDTIKLWRALETLLGDGVTSFILPMCERPFAPYAAGTPSVDIPHSDETLFGDDTGYAQGGLTATISTGAAFRATTVTIALDDPSKLTGGERFSIDHPTRNRRCYEIGRVISVSGQNATVTIWPPLREAVPSGAVADFDKPGCLVRVADPAAFGAAVTSNTYGYASLTFVEDLQDA